MFNIAIIGAGMWGTVHLETFDAHPDAQVTWLCDVSPAALDKALTKVKVPHRTADYHDVLADPDVDAVVIATPPYTHVEIGLDVLRAGKHLLIEKPMGINPTQVQAMLDAAARHPDLVILEGSCRHARLNPKFRFVKALIDAGKLGDVYHITHHHLLQETFIEYNPNATWSMDKALAGGGPFLDWGEYDLSFHLGVLGDKPELQSVTAFTRGGLRDLHAHAPVVDIEMHGAAYLEFDNGLTYTYERGAGVHGATQNETWIFGTKGGLHLYYPTWEPATIDYFSSDPGGAQKEILTVDLSAHPAHDNIPFVAHFLDCLAGRATPMMPVERAAKHLGILFQILE